MKREGVREELDRLKKEKDNRKYERLKLLLKAGKPKPESRAEENDVTNMKTETEDAICERHYSNNIQNQPNISNGNCLLGFAGREVCIYDGRMLSKKIRLSLEVGGGEEVPSKVST